MRKKWRGWLNHSKMNIQKFFFVDLGVKRESAAFPLETRFAYRVLLWQGRSMSSWASNAKHCQTSFKSPRKTNRHRCSCGVVVARLPHTQEDPGLTPGRVVTLDKFLYTNCLWWPSINWVPGCQTIGESHSGDMETFVAWRITFHTFMGSLSLW